MKINKQDIVAVIILAVLLLSLLRGLKYYEDYEKRKLYEKTY